MMPFVIPPGLTRDHIELALAEIDAGLAHPFGSATGYELVANSKSYAPKAVVGVACRHLIGRILLPEEFSSGVGHGQAVHVLRELGYEVKRMADDWTEDEARVIVADYFDILRLELVGRPYSKTEHRNRILPQLFERSSGSIEFKHQNISAILVQRGLPYIEGYKPRGNF